MVCTTSRHRSPVLDAKSANKVFTDLLAGPRRPSSWYDAGRLRSPADQFLPNRGDDHPALAQFGATTGIDVTDPVLSPHTGEHYVGLPGSTLNSATSTYGSTTSGVNVIRVEIDTEVLIPAVATGSVAHISGSGGDLMYLQVDTGGQLRVLFLDSSGAVRTANSTLALPAGTNRGRYAAEWNATTGVFTFYTKSSSDSAWVQFGSTVTVATSGAVRTVTNAAFDTGIVSAGTALSHRCYRAAVYYDGTLRAELNPARDINTTGNPNAGQASWVSASGETWTVNRSATGLKTAVVTRGVVLLDGTDDYIQLPVSDTPTFTKTAGKHTVVVAFRQHNTSETGWLFSSESATDNGLVLGYVAGAIWARVGAGTGVDSVLAAAYTASRLTVVAAVVDNGIVTAYSDLAGVASPANFSGTAGTLAHGTPRMGSRAHTLSFQAECEIFTCLTFKDQALTVTELDAVAANLLAGA